MHPDLKVGLALTLLIVGFAAAMCFRHRPLEPVAPTGELTQDADLDAQLELLPVRTYAEPSETETADSSPVVDVESAELIGFNEGEIEIPEPIASTEDADAPSAEGPEDGPSSSDAEPQRYTVRSGDTLSGIAATFLGSTQRYEEIFEANRHLLNSPDDLRPGMELIIPPKDRAAALVECESEDPAMTETPGEGPEIEPTPAAAQRFTPIVPR